MEELLAMLVEEVSIGNAQQNRKKPLTIPRPLDEYQKQRKAATEAQAGQAETTETGGSRVRGLNAMLGMFAAQQGITLPVNHPAAGGGV